MPLKRRPDTEKADLVDNLARIGGDDFRFWEDDGSGGVQQSSAEYRRYAGVSVASLRSRVAAISPQPQPEPSPVAAISPQPQPEPSPVQETPAPGILERLGWRSIEPPADLAWCEPVRTGR